MLEHEKEPTTEVIQSTLVGWCNEAYSLLKEEGLRVSTEKDKEQANLALRRMLGLFIEEEEYEKCVLVRDILEKNFSHNSSPLFDYREI
jgi:hypothetical protein